MTPYSMNRVGSALKGWKIVHINVEVAECVKEDIQIAILELVLVNDDAVCPPATLIVVSEPT